MRSMGTQCLQQGRMLTMCTCSYTYAYTYTHACAPGGPAAWRRFSSPARRAQWPDGAAAACMAHVNNIYTYTDVYVHLQHMAHVNNICNNTYTPAACSAALVAAVSLRSARCDGTPATYIYIHTYIYYILYICVCYIRRGRRTLLTHQPTSAN